MISHEHRCIFIHIPRTAGSSIETWLCGQDWWLVDEATKHLTAHQAKNLYADCWDDYFKFSFVRNPWDRMVSCLVHQEHFGVKLLAGRLDFTEYENRFGTRPTLEIDHRFYAREDTLRPAHQNHCVYANILDEPLDHIGRFENLEEEIGKLAKRLGIDRPFPSKPISDITRKRYTDYYTKRSRDWVAEVFREDIVKFGYNF